MQNRYRDGNEFYNGNNGNNQGDCFKHFTVHQQSDLLNQKVQAVL